jgi:hypothetical protein
MLLVVVVDALFIKPMKRTNSPMLANNLYTFE